MSIDNHLANMSLNERINVDTSALCGNVTIGDVKRSLKVRSRKIRICSYSNNHSKSLTKAIISASQGMDSLPGTRGIIINECLET